jgi:hypothetical protein
MATFNGAAHTRSECVGPLGGAPVRQLFNSIRTQSVLYRCATCGQLWQSWERAAHPLSDDDARREFPEVRDLI